ncbi:MAG: hypothetical protein JNK14_12735 [Chitinophagaceae bacterium]|nr:hypothetical protein [Chitinophagaceae bacterium]
MKQIAFALQVFSLMAILPAFVIFDMNYETGRSAETHSSPVAKEKSGETSILMTRGLKAVQEIPAVKTDQSILKGDQQCNNPKCTCKKCSCGSDCRCNDMKNDHSTSRVNDPSGIKGLFSILKGQKRS